MGFFFVVIIRLPLLRSSAMILLSDVTIVGGFCSSMTITAVQKARITSALRHPMEEETWRFLLARSLLGDDIDNCVRCWDSALCWTIIASHKIMYQQRLGLYVSIQKIYIYRVGRFDGVRRTERVQSTRETRTAYRTSVSEGVWTTFVHLYGFMVVVGFVQIDPYVCLRFHDNFLHVLLIESSDRTPPHASRLSR